MFKIVGYDKAKLNTFGISKEDYAKIVFPRRSTKYSSGYDFSCPIRVDMDDPDKTYIIPTGIKVDFSDLQPFPGIVYYLALYPRSSYGFKYGFELVNTVGIIDQDYYNNEDNDGHILIGARSKEKLTIMPGDRFCQGIISVSPIFVDNEVEALSSVRTGGLGSTGVK